MLVLGSCHTHCHSTGSFSCRPVELKDDRFLEIPLTKSTSLLVLTPPSVPIASPNPHSNSITKKRYQTKDFYLLCHVLFHTINTSMSARVNLVLLPSYTGDSQRGTGVVFAARASRPMKSFLSRAPRTPSRLIINEKLMWGVVWIPHVL